MAVVVVVVVVVVVAVVVVAERIEETYAANLFIVNHIV